MKKVLLGMVAVALAAAVQAELINRTWSSQLAYAAPSFQNPAVGGDGTGWQIDIALAGSLATDVALVPAASATGTFGWYDGYGYDLPGFAFDADEGLTIVARIYNAGSKGAATHYLDSASVLLPDLDDLNPPAPALLEITFDFGAPAGAGQWQAIPEPATIGLMGIAGLGMYLARRKTRR